MYKRLLVNTGSNLLVMIVKLVVIFVMTPVFVSNLGNYDYGLWEMLAAIVGYAGLLDMGIKPAITRYAAKYRAEKDQDNLEIVYSSALFFLLIVGVLLCAFFTSWGVFFPELIAKESTDTQRYFFLLLIVGIQLLISFPAFVTESYFDGFQKYYLKNNITIFNAVAGAAVLYLFITPENGLLLLAGVNAIGLALKSVLLMWLLTRQEHGAIKPALHRFSGAKLKEVVKFGSKSFVQGVSTRLENTTDALVIGSFLGPAWVPFYSIPATLVNYIRSFGWTLTHAFMPLFSQLEARKEQEKIRSVYFAASKYIVAIILPIAVGVCFVGGPFIGVWLGGEYREGADIIVVLLVIFTAFPFINPVSSRYLTAIGKHGIFAKLLPVSALMNILLSVLLVQEFGIVGVAAGSVIPALIFNPIILVYCCRCLEIPVRLYVYKCVVPSLLPTLGMGISVLAIRTEWDIESYSGIIACAVIGATVYLPLFFYFALSPAERAYVYLRLRLRPGKVG